MLVSRLIKPESDLYGQLSDWSKNLDNFMNWKPLHWFGNWCMAISGFNIIKGQENRYVYWDWNSGSIFIYSIIILATVPLFNSPGTKSHPANLALFAVIKIDALS